MVRDEPHGVDGFDRGACRYDEAFTGQVLFFFKQKTAYEIASGDWSSDVCSSDLGFKAYGTANR